MFGEADVLEVFDDEEHRMHLKGGDYQVVRFNFKYLEKITLSKYSTRM